MELKKLYKDTYHKIRSVLNEYVLYGLFAMGAPEDEYKPEVSQILARISPDYSVEEIAEIVSAVFTEMFGDTNAF